MGKKSFFVLRMIILLLTVNFTNRVMSQTSIYAKCDSISYDEFTKKVSTKLNEMNCGKKYTMNELEDLVKIYTTLYFSEYKLMDGKQNDFREVFDNKYRPIIIDTFECVPSNGSIMYSKRYNLFIGPARNMKCTNYYTVFFADLNEYVPAVRRCATN